MSIKQSNQRKAAWLIVLSLSGWGLISSWEGTQTTAYEDMAGIATIGVGSTYYPAGTKYIRNGIEHIATSKTKVLMGDKITTVEAHRMARDEAQATFGKGIAKCITAPISQNEFDAYTSMSYNIGTNAFCGSTLVRLLNAYNYGEACKQILRWVYVGSKRVQGLVNRRNEEFKMCIGDVQTIEKYAKQ